MISSSSYAPGLAGLLSSIRKDDITQRRRRGTRRNAAGTSGGRLFERRQKARPVTGGSSYSADRAASLQSSRERRAKAQDRIKSDIEGQRKSSQLMRDARRAGEKAAEKRQPEIDRLEKELKQAKERDRKKEKRKQDALNQEAYSGLLT